MNEPYICIIPCLNTKHEFHLKKTKRLGKIILTGGPYCRSSNGLHIYKLHSLIANCFLFNVGPALRGRGVNIDHKIKSLKIRRVKSGRSARLGSTYQAKMQNQVGSCHAAFLMGHTFSGLVQSSPIFLQIKIAHVIKKSA